MTFFTTIIYLSNSELITFYLPVFYTFKFLTMQDQALITKILKFWCVLTLYYPIHHLISFIVAAHLQPIIDILVHFIFVFQEFHYAELIFDTIVAPFYSKNRLEIDRITQKIEKIFEKKSQEMSEKVQESASSRLKNFVGDILVGTLNPNNKKRVSSQEDHEEGSRDDENQEKQE